MKKHFLVAFIILLIAYLFPVGAQITQPQVWSVATSTSTGTLDDFAPGLSSNTIVRMNNATLATIDGFSGGFNGQRLILESVGAGQVDLAPQNAGSSAANRLINFATSGSTSLAAGSGTAEYTYDGVTARWRLVQHEQGAWITGPKTAGDFTASTGTWTSLTVTTMAYRLSGRMLTVSFYITGSSVSATPSALNISNVEYGSFLWSKQTLSTIIANDNGAGNTAGFIQTSPAGNIISAAKAGSNWSVATTATNVLGTVAAEVQD